MSNWPRTSGTWKFWQFVNSANDRTSFLSSHLPNIITNYFGYIPMSHCTLATRRNQLFQREREKERKNPCLLMILMMRAQMCLEYILPIYSCFCMPYNLHFIDLNSLLDNHDCLATIPAWQPLNILSLIFIFLPTPSTLYFPSPPSTTLLTFSLLMM